MRFGVCHHIIAHAKLLIFQLFSYLKIPRILCQYTLVTPGEVVGFQFKLDLEVFLVTNLINLTFQISEMLSI